ncbi:calpain-9, partial [Biomphalaria pfeifferi]
MPSRDYATLNEELLKQGRLFVDPDFPPDTSSLYTDGTPKRGNAPPGEIAWKRPKSLVKKPEFIVDGVDRNDLDQGDLGDCWFIAGAAVLAINHRKQFERVVPLDQGFDKANYTGMFRFNIWWYGDWTEVIIDDFLPSIQGNLIYCRNNETYNEFWPCLLEKAYAKLHGSYEGLEGGFTQDAMVDLTGGISEFIDLRDKRKIPSNLFQLLETSYKMKTLMGAAISPPERASSNEVQLLNGLVGGHAYSITGFKEIQLRPARVELVRLRNPWGHGEWKGAWSDHSPEMKQLSRDVIESLMFQDKDDGEFWMSFEDFKRNFDKLQLCHLQPDAVIQELEDNTDKQMWYMSMYRDSWRPGLTAGGCGRAPSPHLMWRNPQFFVTFDPPNPEHRSTMIVSLMTKQLDLKSSLAIGLRLFKLKQNGRLPTDRSAQQKVLKKYLQPLEGSPTFSYDREVTKRFSFKPGTYVIMPCTYNPDEEGEFILRVFTEAEADSGTMDKILFSFDETDAAVRDGGESLKDLFNKHTSGDQTMTARNLKEFLNTAAANKLQETVKFPLEFCRSLVAMGANETPSSLTFDECKWIWKEVKLIVEVYKEFDKDNSDAVDAYNLVAMFSNLGLPESGVSLNWSVLACVVQRYGGEDNSISLMDFIMATWKLKFVF